MELNYFEITVVFFLFISFTLSLILYKKQIIKTQKNEIIIKFLDRIRNTLDEDILKQIILEEVCNDFKADRTYFIKCNKNDLMKPILKEEYLGNPYVKSLRGNNLDFSSVWEQLEKNNINPPVFAIEESSKFIKQNKLEGTAIDTYLQKSQIKSSYPFLIYESSKSYLYLVIQFTQESVIFNKNDFKIMELITKQTHIALCQASMYTKLTKNNQKEKLLKEVYIGTIGMQQKAQIYTYFAEKIMNLSKATGVVFVEFSQATSGKPKYFENYKKENMNLSKFKNYSEIINLINERTLSYNCDFNKNNQGIDFLKETSTACIGTLPVNSNLLLVVFFESKKEFNLFDKSILFSLVDVISQTVKDCLKTAEINNLRESFLSTLAHDLHVPLIAERNAISYLLAKKNLCEDKNTKEILSVLQETNKQTEEMLRALTSVYKYEAKKKELSRENCNIEEIIDDAISKVKARIEKKNIVVTKEIETANYDIFADFIEITKVIIILLRTAIDESNENAEILITVTEENQYLKCCITGEGGSFREDLSKIISDNKLRPDTVEHRVGEGIYLYLAKLIINAHNGKIYINSKQSEGNIFCIELEKII